MKVRALKDFISTVHGNVDAGQILDMEDDRARTHREYGYVEYVADTPDPAATGGANLPAAATTSSASPAAPASPKQTSTPSVNGGKGGKGGKGRAKRGSPAA